MSAVLAYGGTAYVVAQQPTFLSHPALTPDGKEMVFSYEGDLWKVASQGGVAVRLTGMEGNEINPRISPDGKWLAFSANQNGNMDVYVMPLAGGDIRQLTAHDASDEVDSWSWDSKTLYFTSTRYNRMGGYQVSVDGGTATRLFPHFLITSAGSFLHHQESFCSTIAGKDIVRQTASAIKERSTQISAPIIPKQKSFNNIQTTSEKTYGQR
ncbi:hypothetical protein KUH03_19310 [Sphingobacterium sp. E70]|uniref:hypothetical protein n=1 Tax=Sphingobacterium sp. E70 TaxID=2853439 RepID=UPI00211C7ADD|nr:hypothetical protein [Sphingobacterium sp. E70]ULT28486.1 hypothetical protein KUH03_19310 [Sphingobacterium sp. E70]